VLEAEPARLKLTIRVSRSKTAGGTRLKTLRWNTCARER
jgi:hypothetical protein